MDDRADADVVAEMRRLQTEHASMVAGEIWHPVEARWASHWLAHIGLSQKNAGCGFGPAPGPLDNSKLQGRHKLALSTDIQEHRDFILVHDAVWNLIVNTYGGGPDFPREVITTGVHLLPQLQLYPLIIRVTLADSLTGEPDPEFVFEHPFSSKALISVVLDMASAFFYPEFRDQAGEEQYRLWWAKPREPCEERPCENNSSGWCLIETQDLAKPLIKFELSSEEVHEFLLERKVNDIWPRVVLERDWRDFRIGDVIDALDTMGKWYESTVRDVKPDSIFVHYNNWESKWDEWIARNNINRLAKKGTHTNGPFTRKSTASTGWSSGDVSGTPIARGIVGLKNLGNTCFMNSTLQCMIQCPILTDFFLDDEYLTQLNRTNPLGWQGKVAETYAQMVKDYWNGDLRVFCPRDLKQVIGEFQPRFRGYQQQDSQELLSFLLDALHEDLNRIKEKPLTNAVESNGRPDAVVAKEAWEVHKLRNDSIIADCMQGQVKSTLICPKCHTVGITFDPFFSLPLALPVSTTAEVLIQVVYEKANRPPAIMKVTVDKSACIKQLVEELSKACGIPPSDFVLCDVYNNSIFKIYKPSDAVEEIRPSDETWAYQMTLHNTESVLSNFGGNPGSDSDEEGAIRSDRMGGSVGLSSYAVLTVSNYVDSSPAESEHKKVDPFIAPFPVELPIGIDISASIIRSTIAQTAARFIGVSDLDDVKILLSDRLSSGYSHFGSHRKEIGHDIQSLVVSSHTAFQLLWPPEKAERLASIEPEKASSPFLDKPPTEATLDLNQCFNIFTKEEILSSDDAWRCPSCKVHVCASKRLDLWRMPQVLVILLKRFQYSGMWRNKISTMVEFPLTELSLDSWTPNPEMKGRRYDLFAVSNHFGSLGGGHYTAFVKNLVDGKWYNMDDSMTAPIDAKNVITEAAYVLFYALKST